MQPLHTLNTLLQQAQEQRDAMLSEVQRAAQAHQAALVQLDQLIGYRGEYEARWSAQFKQQGQMELVHCYHGFTGRLTQAVEQQERAVVQTHGRHAELMAQLREQELRVASIAKLIERRQAEHRLVLDRRDAKQSDELAARMLRMRQASGF